MENTTEKPLETPSRTPSALFHILGAAVTMYVFFRYRRYVVPAAIIGSLFYLSYAGGEPVRVQLIALGARGITKRQTQ